MKSVHLVLAFLIAPLASHANDVVLGGRSLTLANIGPNFTTEPDTQTLTRLRASQASAGNLTLLNATLTLPEPKSPPLIISLLFRKLTLTDSVIVTNGHTLRIYAEEIFSDRNSAITSFPATANSQTAGSQGEGNDGSVGENGKAAGTVELKLTRRVVGTLLVALDGEDGTDGSNGRDGANGKPGKNGHNAKARNLFCKRTATSGSAGGSGASGGNGGIGGRGGDGGTLTVTFFNVPIAVEPIRYRVDAGDGGEAGEPGKGGSGGKGGRKGKNTSPCKLTTLDASRGSDGQPGALGKPGVAGEKGSQGQFSAWRIDLPE